MKGYTVYFLLCFQVITNLSAQVDKTFWFAAPEITQEHSDRPILLHILSNEKPTTVTISLPANSSFIPITIEIPADQIEMVNLTAFIDEIENTDVNIPTNKGIFIEATEDVTAYYEVRGVSHGAVSNTDIFVLKGENALGVEFYVPFQNESSNNINHYGKDGWSSIDVVATEDNTKIELFYPKHINTNSQTILLNKGQTYSFRAFGQEASDHLYGARIISTKPIAVTIKDDSVMDMDNLQETDPPSDLIGDQLVPINFIGTQYIVSDGTAYLLATEDNTSINVKGTSHDLSAGEQISIPIGGDPVFIEATAPIYVLHVIDKGGEYGGAIVPSIDCTGSRKISFSYPIGNGFEATILVRKGGDDSFFINGKKSEDLVASNFDGVPGTNGKWLHIHSSLLELKEGQNTIENKSQEFHLSIKSYQEEAHHKIAHPEHGITPDVGSGGYHGYFSNFGRVDLLNDVKICTGSEDGMLTISAGNEQGKYEWNTGDTTSFITFSTQNVIKDSLVYVKRSEGQCQVIDTMTVNIGESIDDIDLGEELELCEGDTHLVSLPTKYFYKWNNGDSTKNYTVKTEGMHKVLVSSQGHCTFEDSLFATFVSLPIVDLGNDTLICNGSSLSLNLQEGYHSYQWNTGETSNTIQVSKEGIYDVQAMTQTKEKVCGIAEDQITVRFWDVHTYNIITPNGDGDNDIFVVEGINEGTWRLEVYNRWGQRVYYDKAYNNTWNAENLNDGTYFFYLTEENEASCNQFHNWLQIVK